MKGKALRKHSLHEKTAASFFKCKQHTCTLHDPWGPEKYNYTMIKYGAHIAISKLVMQSVLRNSQLLLFTNILRCAVENVYIKTLLNESLA